jgi:hypothetical protein
MTEVEDEVAVLPRVVPERDGSPLGHPHRSTIERSTANVVEVPRRRRYADIAGTPLASSRCRWTPWS